MHYVYDKNGKVFKMNHLVDVKAALRTGNYTKLPPGVEEPEAPKKQPEGEKVEGITAVDPEPMKPGREATDKPDDDPAEKLTKVKKIHRK